MRTKNNKKYVISRYEAKKQHKLWISLFLNNMHEKNRSEFSIESYKQDLLLFHVWFECNYSILLKSIKTHHISEYLNFINKGGEFEVIKKRGPLSILFKKNNSLGKVIQKKLSTSSRKRHLSALKNFFDFLREFYEGNRPIFKINPVKNKIHSIKLKDVDVLHTKTLSRKEWELINDLIHSLKDQVMLNILYFGGLRLRELINLKFTDFDFDNETLKLLRKGGKRQELRIENPKLIFDLIRKYYKRREDSPYLFINKYGEQISTKAMYNRITKILYKVSQEKSLSPHSFRKAAATNLYLKTKDLLYVRDYLGHSDAKVTQTYIDSRFFKITT